MYPLGLIYDIRVCSNRTWLSSSNLHSKQRELILRRRNKRCTKPGAEEILNFVLSAALEGRHMPVESSARGPHPLPPWLTLQPTLWCPCGQSSPLCPLNVQTLGSCPWALPVPAVGQRVLFRRQLISLWKKWSALPRGVCVCVCWDRAWGTWRKPAQPVIPASASHHQQPSPSQTELSTQCSAAPF